MSKPKSQPRKAVKAAVFPEVSEPVQLMNYEPETIQSTPDLAPSIVPEGEVIPLVVELMIVRSVAATIRRGFDEKYCPYRSDSPEAARWLQLYNERILKNES